MEFTEEDEFSTDTVVHIFSNLLLMLSDRGYDTYEKYLQYKDMSLEEFWRQKKQWSDLNEMFMKGGKKLQTIWLPETDVDKIKIEPITTNLKAILPEELKCDVIIISNKEIGTPTSSKLEVFINWRIEFFTYDRLRINIPKHFLIDRVELLKEDEVKALLSNIQAERYNLKILSIEDMITRWYGLRADDVVRIHISRENIGQRVDYRVVRLLDLALNPTSKNAIFN